METQRYPALTRDQWQERRTGSVAIERTDDEVRLVARIAEGELLVVSGADNLRRLIALANDALPDSDPRKITGADIAFLKTIADSVDGDELDVAEMLALAETLSEKVGALLLRR
jgi:hypothetical protein